MSWAALIDDAVRVRNGASAGGRGWESIRGGWASSGPAASRPATTESEKRRTVIRRPLGGLGFHSTTPHYSSRVNARRHKRFHYAGGWGIWESPFTFRET